MGRKAGVPAETLLGLRQRLMSLPARAPERRQDVGRIAELIWPVAWQTRAQAENAVARYIDGFYNPVRRHSSLAFHSPIAFERKAREVS